MRPLIVANWKMNTNLAQALLLAGGVKEGVSSLQGVDVVICPPFPFLVPIAEELQRHRIQHLYLGAQDIAWQDSGAYTGEVAAAMLQNICDYVIIGHSERRQYFLETDEMIAKKVSLAFRSGLKPILCVGELKRPSASVLEDPTQLTAHHILKPLDELEAVLDRLGKDDRERLLVAYEPVWAISAGGANNGANNGANSGAGVGGRAGVVPVAGQLPAPGHYANAVAAMLKEAAGFDVPVLYGGSVKADNAREFLHQENIAGLLVGGASLQIKSFVAICKA